MNSMKNIKVGALVREARRRSKLTQRDLAARAGTTQSVVARIEADGGSPRMETVERLLEAAGFRPVVALEPIRPVDRVVGAYRRDIDRTLLGDNLRKSPEDRVRALQALHDLAHEARQAGRAKRRA